MTRHDDTAQQAVSAGLLDASQPAGMAAVRWLAAYHNRPFSSVAVLSRVPQDADLTSASGQSRALTSIGMKSRLVRRRPDRIDPVSLPFLALRDGQGPLIVTDIKGKTAEVVDPDAGDMTEEVTLRDLKARTNGQVLLATLVDEGQGAHQSALTRSSTAQAGHWFWGPVRANWSNWMQVLLAALLLNLLTLALPLFVMNVYDRVIPNLAFVTLGTLATGVGIALGLDLIIRTIRANLLENIGRRVDLKVAARLFDHAMHARLLQRPGGAAGIAATIRDFEVVREFFGSATFVAIIDVAFIGVFVAALYFIVGPIALIPLLAVPVVLTLAIVAQIPLGRAAARAQAMATKRHVVLMESLAGIETIKSLGAEPLMQREWERAVTASARINGRTRFWSNIAAHGTMLVQQTVSVLIIVWGVFLVSDGQITIGGLIAANILASRVLAPLGTVAQTIFRAQYAVKSLKSLNAFMRLPAEQSPAIASDLSVSRGAVQLKDLTFRYPEAAHAALDGLSMDIPGGACVAILGKVGCGKTTLGKVISGLLAPDAGTLLVDGVAQDQYEMAELRRGIGYLPQSPELFTGTLRENLTIGTPTARDEDVAKALYYAAMDGFVDSLPEGLDFFIGDGGERLSGGQRQGIALARLILRAPKLLYLDEPTNAMDQRMQGQVITRLGELNRSGTGLVLCTHRQSLADMADRIIVMDQGRLVLDGARADVLAQLRTLRDAQRTEGQDVRQSH